MQKGQELRDHLARSFSRTRKSVEVRLEDVSRIKQTLRIKSEELIEEENIVARVKEYFINKGGLEIEDLTKDGCNFKIFRRGVRKGVNQYIVVTISVFGEDWADLVDTHLSLITINGQLS